MSHVTRVIRGLQKAGENMCAVISAEFTREAQQREARLEAAKAPQAESTVKAASEAPVAQAPRKRITPHGWW